MTKNYFTDEQVKEALEKLGMRRPFSSHSLQHYKNLMNLAVEVAIGEPVAYCRRDTVLDWKGQSINIAYMFPSPEGLLNPISLYSVKELEN